MTPWEADVASAVSEALAGHGNADTSRVLAAEVHRLQLLAFGTSLAREALRCPFCHEIADSMESRLDSPTRYRHGQIEHFDRTDQLRV